MPSLTRLPTLQWVLARKGSNGSRHLVFVGKSWCVTKVSHLQRCNQCLREGWAMAAGTRFVCSAAKRWIASRCHQLQRFNECLRENIALPAGTWLARKSRCVPKFSHWRRCNQFLWKGWPMATPFMQRMRFTAFSIDFKAFQGLSPHFHQTFHRKIPQPGPNKSLRQVSLRIYIRTAHHFNTWKFCRSRMVI